MALMSLSISIDIVQFETPLSLQVLMRGLLISAAYIKHVIVNVYPALLVSSMSTYLKVFDPFGFGLDLGLVFLV